MKKVICSFTVFCLTLLSISYIKAQADISSDVDVTYQVLEDGVTEVTYDITLKNIFTDRYAKSYSLKLEGTAPENIEVFELDNSLEFTTESFENTKRITIVFPEAVVGKDKARQFTVKYIDKTFVNKNGDVWEVSIPRLGSPDAFKSYNVKIAVPPSFGDPAYISPSPSESEQSTYSFSKEIMAAAGVHAAFGKFQTYELKLNYQLENPLHQNTMIEIALPPDTSYQRVFIKEIDPRPDKLTSDEDGNWIASYSLMSREQKEVKLLALTQVFSSPIRTVEISKEYIQTNTRATQYWPTGDKAIQTLAQRYTTPREIYDYVIRTLDYNHARVLPNADRLGAVKALENPSDALCTEFTDTFIALARAAGIPAREVNGYAFSDNASLQPLSLVTDVLHSWPEYWDAERKAWIAVDPTWEDTTGGIDYFNNMDLKHIAFVVHGKDDTLPYPAGSYKLGAYPEKNVEVQIGELPKDRESKPEIAIKTTGVLPVFHQNYNITVFNPGPTALYNLPVEVVLGDKNETFNVEALLPYGSFSTNIKAPVGALAVDLPDKVEVNAGTTNYSINTKKTEISLYHSAIALLVVLASTAALFIYLSPKLHIKLWKRS